MFVFFQELATDHQDNLPKDETLKTPKIVKIPKKEKSLKKDKHTKSEKKKKEKKKRENPIRTGWEDIAEDKDMLKFSLYYIS